MKKMALLAMVTLAILTLSPLSHAGVIPYASRPVFNGLGVIDYNSNFNDFGTYFGLPGDPFTRGDVTYHSTQNLTWGASTGYTTTQPLIGNNWWTPILGDIATGPQYDMFGFDIGTYNPSTITIEIFTNLASYTYPNLTIVNSQLGLLEFRGYVASSGEYFTGFDISADAGGGNLPGITNVALGHTAVPEPGSLTLLGSALIGLLLVLKRR